MLRSSAFALAFLLAAGPARSLDLTGTWEGGFKCSEFVEGASKRFPQKRQIFRISQSGNDVRVEWTDPTQAPAPVFPLSGFAIPDAKKPETKGELVLTDCETSADLAGHFADLSRYRVRVKPVNKKGKAKGKLKGFTIYAPVGAHVGSCTARFKRIDAADPGVGGCP